MAGQAPSGLNRQPWLYVVVLNKDLKKEIRNECERVESEYYQNLKRERDREFKEIGITIKKSFLTDAPALVCLFGKKSEPYFRESVWLSVGWFIIAAGTKSLSTLTYTPHKMDFLNRILNINREYQPEVILPLGYGTKKGLKKRKSPKEIMRFYE